MSKISPWLTFILLVWGGCGVMQSSAGEEDVLGVEAVPIGSRCKHTFSSGTTYDFSGAFAALGELSCFSTDGYRFVFAPCGIVKEPVCNTPNPGQSTCQMGSEAYYSYGIGTKTSASYSQELPGGRGFTLKLSGGDGGRTSTIQFKCDRDSKGTLTCGNPVESPTLNYNLIFTSKYACAVVPGQGGEGGGSSALAGGWIFIIVLGSVLLVYFVGGVLFQKFYKKESGLALIPNVEFWKMLPGLVKDGVMFSIAKVKLGIDRLRGNGSYDSV
ncbi:Autophagy-related protein 27 [Balamuthia mandrillaris]